MPHQPTTLKCPCKPGHRSTPCCPIRTDYALKQLLEAASSNKSACFKAVDAPSQVNTDFGFSVALSADGNLLVVGAPRYDVTNANGSVIAEAGLVYVFERRYTYAACKKHGEGDFVLLQTLTAKNPDADDGAGNSQGNYGMSVAVSGDGTRIAVGAPFQNEGTSLPDEDNGAVFIYDRVHHKRCPPTYELTQTLFAQKRKSANDCTVVSDTDTSSGFGYRLALSRNGRVLAVADPFFPEVGTDFGFVYLYEECSVVKHASPCGGAAVKKPFAFKQRIAAQDVARDANTTVDDLMQVGLAVALTGDGCTLVFSADYATVSDVTLAGQVFVYRRQCDTKLWEFSQSIDGGVERPMSQQDGDQLGVALAITPDGKFLAVEAGPVPIGGPSGNPPSGFVRVYKNTCESGVSSYEEEGEALFGTGLQQNAFAVVGAFSDVGVLGQQSLAISDDGCVIVTGFEFSKVSEQDTVGEVLVFKREKVENAAATPHSYHDGKKSSSVWKQVQQLNEKTVRASALFGNALALSGDGLTLAAAATGANDSLEGDQLTGADLVSVFGSYFCKHH